MQIILHHKKQTVAATDRNTRQTVHGRNTTVRGDSISAVQSTLTHSEKCSKSVVSPGKGHDGICCVTVHTHAFKELNGQEWVQPAISQKPSAEKISGVMQSSTSQNTHGRTLRSRLAAETTRGRIAIVGSQDLCFISTAGCFSNHLSNFGKYTFSPSFSKYAVSLSFA